MNCLNEEAYENKDVFQRELPLRSPLFKENYSQPKWVPRRALFRDMTTAYPT